MSKISGEMLAEIKHGIETGEDKNGIKVDGLAYTWKQLEPLYQYIQTIQNEYKTLQKRNSRQRLANQKQYELILKLQQENEELKKNQRYYKNGVFSLEYDKETLSDMVDDYKSRCEKASDKLSFIDEALESDTLNVPLCITKINSALNILQNGSEDK